MSQPPMTPMSLWVMGGGAEDAIRSSGEPSIPDDLLRCTERPGRVESRCGAPHRRGPRANPPYTAQIDVCVPGLRGFEPPNVSLTKCLAHQQNLAALPKLFEARSELSGILRASLWSRNCNFQNANPETRFELAVTGSMREARNHE